MKIRLVQGQQKWRLQFKELDIHQWTDVPVVREEDVQRQAEDEELAQRLAKENNCTPAVALAVIQSARAAGRN